MEYYQTWRDLLATLIEKPRERTRLAKAVGVSTLTLQRWISHEASPRPQDRQRLLEALPQHSRLLRVLLAEEFHDFDTEPDAEINNALVELATRVFTISASVPDESRFWSVCTAVLSAMVQQLDPDHLGLSLRMIQCMAPPLTGCVRYLRESASLGTPPWPAQIEAHTSFLGAESLAGRAVATGQSQMMADSKQEQDVYSSLPEQCRSAMALPILHSGRIAGCLLAVSTQAGYFAIPVHAAWLQHSTALLKMAFSPEHFYLPKQIALLRMPALQVQRPYLAGCQRRVLAILKTAFLGNHPLSYREAQHYVWEQIAEELLQLQSPPI